MSLVRRLARPAAAWDRGSWLFAGLALYVLVYSAVRLAGGPDFGESLANRALFLPAGVAACFLAVRAFRGKGSDPGTRRAWWLLAAAFLALLTGNALWLFGFEAHAAWLLYYPLLLAGVLSFPRTRRSPAEWLQFRIDAASVFCGGAMAIWFFLLRPAAHPLDRGAFLSFAYPLGDLVLLLGIALLALRRVDEPYRPVFLLLTLGLLVEFSGDVLYGAMTLAGKSPDTAASDLAYMLGWGIRGAAAHTHCRVPSRPPPARPLEAPALHGPSLLPLGFVAVGYATLFCALAMRAATSSVAVLVAGAASLTILALASQAVTAREGLRLQAELGARSSEARFRTLVQNSSDVIAVVDAEATLLYVAPSAERLLGLAPEALYGRPLAGLLHPEDELRARVFLSHAMVQPGLTGPVELRLATGGGRWITMEAVATNLLSNPEIGGVVLTLRDMRERKELEEQLIHRALHDPLTGLANRALFGDRLRHAQTLSARQHSRYAVAVLDLDDFKAVNDGLGHATGDQVLVEAARRVRGAVRDSDTAARLGGDEFAVLIEAVEGEDDLRAAAATILAAIAAPFTVGTGALHLTASLGAAASAADATEDEVLRQADVALYHAKESGKGRSALFAPGMRSALLRRHEMEADLRRAIEQRELYLVYQPVVSLRSGRVVGAEALARWRHRDRGLVPPGDFIDLAEASGLIEPLGAWVIDQACRQAAVWHRLDRRGLSVGVNLSMRQLYEPGIVDQMRAALAEHELPRDLLVCEITESLPARDPLAAAARLHELKATGVRLALDDFGTGYSSLGHLRDLPIDILKIDGAFTRHLGTEQDSSLARAIVMLGKAIGLLLVAEGVESAGQAAALRELGCDLGQGFHFGPPVTAEELTERLRRPPG